MLARAASTWFDTTSHGTGAALVGRIAELAEAAGDHPDIDVRATGVHVRTFTHDATALTDRDVALARDISAVARDLGLTADPSAIQQLQLTVDAHDQPAVMPFWRAALAYDQAGDDDLVDPLWRDAEIWFQTTDVPRPLRNRLDVDIAVSVGREEASMAASQPVSG